MVINSINRGTFKRVVRVKLGARMFRSRGECSIMRRNSFLVIAFSQHYGKIILRTRYLYIFLNGLVGSNCSLEENVKVRLETEFNTKVNENIR